MIKRRPEAVDIGRRAEFVQLAGRLLGTHVGRRADRRALHRLHRTAQRGRRSQRSGVGPDLALAQRLGQTPVDDERLAVLTDHDVARLQIPVQHAPAVRVVHRVADDDEPTQKLPQRHLTLALILEVRVVGLVKLFDRLLEAVALDEPHRIVRPTIVTLTEGIHRHDAGMFEPAGDFGLQHKPFAGVRVVGEMNQNLL